MLPDHATGYAELHCITNYSFLRGASHPEELVHQAASLGYSAIAITDECSMAGVVKAHIAARDCGIKLIIGSEFYLDDGASDKAIHLLLLAPSRTAYGQICHLITTSRRRANKGEYQLSCKDLVFGLDECLALWLPGGLPGGLPQKSPTRSLGQIPQRTRGKSPPGKSLPGKNLPGKGPLGTSPPGAEMPGNAQDPHLSCGKKLKEIFGERLWISLQVFLDGQEINRYQKALALSKALNIPLVASGDVHMHVPERKPLLDIVSAVRMGQSVRLAGRLLASNREKHLRPIKTLQQLFPPALLQETLNIANRCHFHLSELRYEYPRELVPPQLSPSQYLRQLVEVGAKKRWPGGIKKEVAEIIEKELTLVAELEYEYYFLTVFDIVDFARNQGILCQGRGSAANSAICYCLGITEVDPQRVNLLFERFISAERHEPPDIDVDFEHERREEVIQYLYKKYGRHRAALAATVVTYRPKSAIRDVGKALGMDLQLVNQLSKSLSWWDKKAQLLDRFKEAGIDPRSPLIGQFVSLVNQILGFPRHLSQHVGGVVIGSGSISQLVPVENAAMEDRTIIQWDKDDLEALGLLKVDVLSLGMLTAIRKSLRLINTYRNTQISFADIPSDDQLTYQMLQKGDSIGVFQVESRAQISMLPRLKPENFYDLVIEVAIVRPGPIQGNMVHPYLKRRDGLEPVTYANDAVKEVLERTLGIPIFQEQVIKLAMVAAGFSAGEADQLRRAMAAWKRKGGLEPFEDKLINGMLERGHERAFAERIFEQIKGFGDYGFPESHAASFALLVYVSAWIKCHEPAAFYCGLLNSQPMGFYSPSQLVQDARRHDIEIRPVDVLYSGWESTLEQPAYSDEIRGRQPAVRLGMQRIKGLSEETALRILGIRNQVPQGRQSFRNVENLAKQAGLDREELARLTEAGALKTLSGHRYQTHWEVQGILPPIPLLETGNKTIEKIRGMENTARKIIKEETTRITGEEMTGKVILSPPSETDDLRADYTALGLTLGRHPMAILRDAGEPFTPCKTASDLTKLNHGRFVQVAGIVTGRQRPSSASGVIFLTLEDETNNINVVIWTRVLERFRKAVIQGRLLKIKGVMEREASVIHVIAGHIEDLSRYLSHFSRLSLKSRDFH